MIKNNPDFWLFPRLKLLLRGKSFVNVVEIKQNVARVKIKVK